MSLENNYISDIEEILSHRYDNGGDYYGGFEITNFKPPFSF